jgi:response regulator RpfG family c-di-GMP phosphodiesterase
VFKRFNLYKQTLCKSVNFVRVIENGVMELKVNQSNLHGEWRAGRYTTGDAFLAGSPHNKYMQEPLPYILLIDDDEDDLQLLSSALVEKAIIVKTFLSSSKAIFYLSLMSGNRELPSLIIMDYNMPVKNGYQVLQLLKANKNTSHIPVVLYSTTLSDELRKRLSAAGVLACFVKPWTSQEFNRQVEVFQELAFSFGEEPLFA